MDGAGDDRLLHLHAFNGTRVSPIGCPLSALWASTREGRTLILAGAGGLAWRGFVALASVTVAFGALNELLVGRFWFFLPHFSKALLVWSRYDQDPVTFLDTITRPFLFFVLFVLYNSIKWLREHNWSIREVLVTDYGIVLAIFWAQIALLFVTQAIHMRSEQVDEYNSMIIGFIFAVLSFRVLTIPEKRGWGSLVVIAGAIALGLVFSDPNARADYMNVTLKWPQGSIHLGLLTIVAIMLIAESKLRLRPRAQVIRAAGTAALCLASISAVGFTAYQPLVRGFEVFQNPREYRAVYHAPGSDEPVTSRRSPANLERRWRGPNPRTHLLSLTACHLRRKLDLPDRLFL